MAAEEHLTDAQLVSELAKYGEKVELPLKRNKRPVLLKKLNHLRVRSNKERAAATPPKKSLQSTASAFSKFSDRRNNESETELRNNVQIPKASTPYTRDSGRNFTFADRFRQSDSQTLVSDDSDVDAPSSSFSHHNRLPAKSYRNLDDRETITNRSGTRHSLADQYLASRVPGTLKHTTPASSRAYNIRDDNKAFLQNPEEDEDDDKPQSPPRSRLYPDLGRFTPSSLQSDRFESSDSDIDDRANKSLPYSSRVTRHRDVSSSFPSKYQRTSVGSPHRERQLKSSYFAHLPRILIIIVVLFFVVVAASYIMQNKDYVLSWFPSSGSDDVLLICSDTTKNEVCYEKEVVDQALQYLGKLFTVLSFKKGQVLCGDAKPGQDVLTVSDLQSQMYKHFPQTKNVELLLECCLHHILLNPHWKIRAVQENGTVAASKEEIARLESEEPSMGILCRLRRSCFTVFYELCLTAAAVAIFVLLSMLVRHRLKKKELEQKEVYEMVDEILEILQDHYEHTKGKDSDESTYLAVQHVRDQLLPPATRHKLQPVWDKAVAFIAANESRVRMETRLIQGDEFDVWRWLQPPVPESRSKKIPGLASKYIERDNQVSQKPTVCLKICKMYNSSVVSEDDDWEEEVISAVLEKCRGVDSVVHACVDAGVEEGCVFLKCSHLEAAVEAKDELHGWRRKGQTVIVKYLKTDEYHKLFPVARHATRPLHPSTARSRM